MCAKKGRKRKSLSHLSRLCALSISFTSPVSLLSPSTVSLLLTLGNLSLSRLSLSFNSICLSHSLSAVSLLVDTPSPSVVSLFPGTLLLSWQPLVPDQALLPVDAPDRASGFILHQARAAPLSAQFCCQFCRRRGCQGTFLLPICPVWSFGPGDFGGVLESKASEVACGLKLPCFRRL